MEIVVDIVLPIFGVAVMGYLATRIGWFSSMAEKGLAKFVFDFAIPLMLFRSLATADLPSEIPWGYFISYYTGAVSMYGLGIITAKLVFKRDLGGGIITGFGYAFGNTVLLGLPLILTTFGDEAAFPFFLLLSIHGLCFFTVTTFLLEYARNREKGLAHLPKEIGKAIVTNPILIGIIAGLTLNLSGLGLWGPANDICALMQQAVTPCSLFALGASLTKYGIAGRVWQAITMSAAKLVLMPAIVFVLAHFVFEIQPLWTMVAVLMAAQPSGVMTYIFAQKYGTGQAIATTAIFMSTTASVVTLSVILYLFDVR